jgi:integrase
MADDAFSGPFNFTEASVKRLCEAVRLGTVDAGEWNDAGSQVGLYLRVGPRGGVFYSLRASGGKVRRQRIGKAASMRVATAREQATQIAAGNEAGSRPIRVATGTAVADEVFEEYLTAAQDGTFRVGRGVLAASTAKSYRELWKPHIKPRYGSLKLSQLAASVMKVHESLATKPATQKRMMQLLKNVFSYAIKKGLWADSNPVIDKATGKPPRCGSVPERERFLSEGELARFMEYVEAADEPWPDYWQLLLLTGVRKSTLMAMAWNDVDLDAGQPTWRIGTTKNGSPLVVPLLPESVAILRRRARDREEGCEWVFPTNRSKRSHCGHIKDVDNAWNRLRDATGLKDVRVHDVRRTAGTIAVKEHSLPAVARFLGQKTLKAAAIYARCSDKDAREVGGTVAAAMKRSRKRKPK